MASDSAGSNGKKCVMISGNLSGYSRASDQQVTAKQWQKGCCWDASKRQPSRDS